MRVLLLRPSDDSNKGLWVEMDWIPRSGEEVHVHNHGYSVHAVKHFLDAEEIPEYKDQTPFVRIFLK